MSEMIIGLLKQIAMLFGFNLTTPTNKKDIKKLIRALHPVQTNYDLIRLGPNSDGGYLVPNNLNEIEACFSPGIGKVVGFEKDCLERGMKLFLADKSVNIEKVELSGNNVNYTAKFIGCTNNNDFITLDKWVGNSKINQESDLLLQMDIEGFEYAALINVSDELLKRFRIIIIEFHYLHRIWEKGFFEIFSQVVNKILQSHSCVHLHPNNISETITLHGIKIPKLIEVTFFRNDMIKWKKPQTTFPHPLDFDNIKGKTIILPDIWFKPE